MAKQKSKTTKDKSTELEFTPDRVPKEEKMMGIAQVMALSELKGILKENGIWLGKREIEYIKSGGKKYNLNRFVVTIPVGGGWGSGCIKSHLELLINPKQPDDKNLHSREIIAYFNERSYGIAVILETYIVLNNPVDVGEKSFQAIYLIDRGERQVKKVVTLLEDKIRDYDR